MCRGGTTVLFYLAVIKPTRSTVQLLPQYNLLIMDTDGGHGQTYGLSLSGVRAHGPAYGEEPHGGAEVEDEHHEKKPVLKKVKEKVKKIKDTLGKKMHSQGNDHNHGHEVDEEDNGYEDDDEEQEVDPEVHGAPMCETTRAQNLVTGEEKHPANQKVRLGDVKGTFGEDPAAPFSRTGGEEDSSSPTGINEMGMSPILHSFQAMSVADQPQPQEKKGGEQIPPTGSQDQFAPEPVSEEKRTESSEPPKEKSYTEKISSATTAAKDAAALAAAGSVEYGKKIASTVYEKVAGAGVARTEKVKLAEGTEQEGGINVVQPDKGVSVKQFLAEKLKPGDEDRDLCEVISDVIHKRKQEEEEEGMEKEVNREEATRSRERTGGTRVVEKIRGKVTSLFGVGSRARPESQTQPKGQLLLPYTLPGHFPCVHWDQKQWGGVLVNRRDEKPQEEDLKCGVLAKHEIERWDVSILDYGVNMSVSYSFVFWVSSLNSFGAVFPVSVDMLVDMFISSGTKERGKQSKVLIWLPKDVGKDL